MNWKILKIPYIILVAKSWTMYYIKCSSGREALLKGKTQYS
jgi:hypothetical protein